MSDLFRCPGCRHLVVPQPLGLPMEMGCPECGFSGKRWTAEDITLIIFGAADPEQVAAERLARAAGWQVAYATTGGKRCHPGNAYQCDWMHRRPEGGEIVRLSEVANVDCIVLFECGGHGRSGSVLLTPGQHAVGGRVIEVVRLDHHRPGDQGYGRPPEEFLAASSIGQLLRLLHGGAWVFDPEAHGDSPSGEGLPTGERLSGWALLCARCCGGGEVYVAATDSDVICPACAGSPALHYAHREQAWLAAADHCLEAAYRGHCPGVDPDELMRWRAESRGAFQKRPASEVLADVELARAILHDSARQSIETLHGVTGLADLRGQTVPELPEAACREGIPYLATATDRDGREKVTLGAASPELVRRFLAGEIVPGLKDCYGDPARGFAGGYVP